MDVSAIVTIAASVAGVIGAILGGWQLRVQILDRRDRHSSRSAESRLYVSGSYSVTPPFGRLPRRVIGRDELFTELTKALRRKRGGLWVLAGVGGIGKSTVALQVGKAARERGWQVWWVNASDSAAIAGGIIEILDRLGAPDSVLRAVQEGAPVAVDRAWEVLARHKGAKRCLLIFDNADAPEMLAVGGSRPSEGTGWVRPEGGVLQIVTTRHSDPLSWGASAQIRLLKPLDDASGAEALRDLAGSAERGDGGAISLARRLGGMPLALHLAGAYLGSSFARWRSFTDYMSALDSPEFLDAMADLDHDPGDSRLTVAGTWELSVNALAARGMPQARALLQLLACFAPATPISAGMLRSNILSDVLSLYQERKDGSDEGAAGRHERLIFQGLQGLSTVGLIDIIEGPQVAMEPTLMVHPVIADINRASLLTRNRNELVVIGNSAVHLVDSATEGLDTNDPSSWSDWRLLTSHLSALVSWLAPELEAAKLGRLVHICVDACDALIVSGNWNDADHLAQVCVRAATRLGEDDYEALRSRRALALTIAQYERYAEVEKMLREILAGQRRALGDEHPDTLRTSQQMAWIIGEQGRFDEAEPRLRETFATQTKVLGSDHPDTLNTQHDLAWSMAGQHRYADAEQLCRQVLAARERTVGPEHLHTLATKANLVWMIAQQGRYQEAEKMGRTLYEEKQHVLGIDNPYTLEQARGLALAILHQNRQDEAEQLLRDTLTRQEKTLGATHAKTAATRAALTSIQTTRSKKSILGRRITRKRAETAKQDPNLDRLPARSAEASRWYISEFANAIQPIQKSITFAITRIKDGYFMRRTVHMSAIVCVQAPVADKM